jgi:GNAT superfamily N-acetyltransferase
MLVMAEQLPSSRPVIRALLLLPHHIKPTPSNSLLLTQLKNVLNLSYTATYCAKPALFGTDHVRIADSSQIADIIGPDGFTVALIMEKRGEEVPDNFEIVATASVKNFGEGDIREYFKWTKNIGGKQWAAKSGTTGKEQGQINPSPTTSAKPEISALGVHPDYQKLGLGVKIMEEIEWLLTNFAPGGTTNDGGFEGLICLPKRAPLLEGVCLKQDQESMKAVGIDLDALRQQNPSENKGKVSRTVVLTCVRELGNEVYYKKRGYETLHTGVVPVGMWDAKQECTMAYMEKQLL